MTKVLVAEDSPTQAEELAFLLRSEGYEVELAPDGQAAFDRLSGRDIDVVASDVQMPNKNGYELCRAIKESPEFDHIPVILLTHLSDTLDIVRGLACGADNFITKPYETKNLIGRLEAVLATPSNDGNAIDESLGKVEIECRGVRFEINAQREQMLNFLMSTFDEFVRSKEREADSRLQAETRRRRELGELTEELKTMNARLTKLASIDPLTEVLNRRGLQSVLTIEMNRSQRTGTQLIAALLDLDGFERINDQLGHAVGDVVLKEAAQRLEKSLRTSDRVGRVGGDEFMILFPDTDWAEAQQVANRVRLAVGESPIVVFDDLIRTRASIGTAILPEQTCSIEEVLTLTRQGLENAKSAGGNRVATANPFISGTPPAAESPEQLRNLLHEDNSFRAVSQAIYRLDDGTLAGYELLSRGPKGAYEMPDDFFRVCLEGNFLTSADLQCLKRCVAAAAKLESGRFHVNLFPSTIFDTPPERLIELLQTDDESVFCIEMSEQQFIGDPSSLKSHIEAFRKSGILVAMDDVGFGRSSLETLVLLEPDLVKIDPKYVMGISSDPDKAHSIGRLIKVANSLGAELVAEGIETAGDLEMLRDMGVAYGQGFYWGRPS